MNNMIMNLKYNRIDMKNQGREGRCSMKLRQRFTHVEKPKLHKKKTTREKKSPSTREFGTDLTNRPQLQATQPQLLSEHHSPNSPQITPYLPHIVQHLIYTDQQFTDRQVARIASQTDCGLFKISPEMRKVLLKWLMQVGRKFQVKDETIHICVQLVDTVILFEPSLINKLNFQLLGVTSLFVASKYHQIHTFEADKYVYVCDGLYSLTQLFEMESLILTTTNFNMQFPTLHQFTGIALQHYRLELHKTVSELSRLSMFDFLLFNRFQKQHLAGVIIYFAGKIQDQFIMRSKDIIEELGVPEYIFRECFMTLLGLYRSREELQ